LFAVRLYLISPSDTLEVFLLREW